MSYWEVAWGRRSGWLSKCWSLFGYPKYWVPYYHRDPKRDHSFDNHPSGFEVCIKIRVPFFGTYDILSPKSGSLAPNIISKTKPCV